MASKVEWIIQNELRANFHTIQHQDNNAMKEINGCGFHPQVFLRYWWNVKWITGNSNKTLKNNEILLVSMDDYLSSKLLILRFNQII